MDFSRGRIWKLATRERGGRNRERERDAKKKDTKKEKERERGGKDIS